MKNGKLVFVSLLVFALFSSNINRPKKVFMIGDSTMADKQEKAFPENGWGMALGGFLKDQVQVQNHAVNGRSTKSFIAEGRWDTICNRMKKGDFVIIQFGHNDEKITDSTRYTIPQSTYKANCRKFVLETRKNGGNPILCTPIVRRHFGESGQLVDTHGEYPQAMREVAHEMNVPLVDLEKLTQEKLNNLGAEKSEKFFMILKAGEYPNFPEGKSDNTHLNVEGARMVAELFVNDVKKQKIPFSKLLK